jgi:hypothetical protein
VFRFAKENRIFTQECTFTRIIVAGLQQRVNNTCIKFRTLDRANAAHSKSVACFATLERSPLCKASFVSPFCAISRHPARAAMRVQRYSALGGLTS